MGVLSPEFDCLLERVPMLWVAKRLLLAVMLIHSVFGCCWHHAHSCACDHETQASTRTNSPASHNHRGCVHREVSHTVRHSCAHHHHHTHSVVTGQPLADQDQEPVPHRHQCDHGTCTFVVDSGRIAIPDLDLVQPFIVDFECLMRPTAPQAIHEYRETHTFPGTAALRCAVLQVWLI